MAKSAAHLPRFLLRSVLQGKQTSASSQFSRRRKIFATYLLEILKERKIFRPPKRKLSVSNCVSYAHIMPKISQKARKEYTVYNLGTFKATRKTSDSFYIGGGEH